MYFAAAPNRFELFVCSYFHKVLKLSRYCFLSIYDGLCTSALSSYFGFEFQGDVLPTVADFCLAEQIARDAAALLLEIRDTAKRDGSIGSEVGKYGDAQAESLISFALKNARPGDSILSEEQSHDDMKRISSNRVWIVDPLDGTREYSALTRDDWAIHIALWERNNSGSTLNSGTITVGVVALPATGVVFNSASIAPPVFTPREFPTIVVSASRAPAWIMAMGEELGAQIIPMGSAGAKAMEVVMGRADAYVHAGGQYEWDSAAPVGVALTAGLHASRLDGSELLYNQVNPYLPDLIVCRRDLSDKILRSAFRLEALNAK